jgi:histidinol-phosphate aminotransferase
VERDSREVYQKLLKKGVIVRGMTPWNLNTFIRVTVGKKKENQRFLKALKEILGI